jgi:hypothetical protein
LLAHVEERCGSFEDPALLRDGLAYLHEHANVLLPVSRVRSIPRGHAVTLASVIIMRKDCYPAKGKAGHHALHKVALDKLASAAGVSWDPVLSKRTDDGSDPLVCEWREVGTVIDIDGSTRTIKGTNRQDLREDGADTLSIIDESRDASTAKKTLLSRRKWIVAHAESKARARAIRAGLGVRSSYTEAQLRNPFVAAKLTFTGQFHDAETNRAVAILAAVKALGLSPEAMAGVVRGIMGPAAALPAPTEVAASMSFEGEVRVTDPSGFEPDLDDSIEEADVDDTVGDPVIARKLVELAGQKGRLGLKGEPASSANAGGRMTEAQIMALDLDGLERLDLKLRAMPDKNDNSDDPIPF